MEKKEYQKKIEIVTDVSKRLMGNLPYHNFSHAEDVYKTVITLGTMGNVNYEDMFLLKTAALLHDIIVVPRAKDNEERSAEFTRIYLPTIGYSSYHVEKIANMILATKVPQNPKNFLEQIICDADLDNFGREDFLELGEKVREELGLHGGKDWYLSELKLLKGHRYHTEMARKLRDHGKEANIQKLEKMLQDFPAD